MRNSTERLATKLEHCIQLFGRILHKNLGPLERQIKMKVSTVLASFLGLLTAFLNTIAPWYCKIDFTKISMIKLVKNILRVRHHQGILF